MEQIVVNELLKEIDLFGTIGIVSLLCTIVCFGVWFYIEMFTLDTGDRWAIIGMVMACILILSACFMNNKNEVLDQYKDKYPNLIYELKEAK